MTIEVHGHLDSDKVINTLAWLLCDQLGLEFKGVTRIEETDSNGTSNSANSECH